MCCHCCISGIVWWGTSTHAHPAEPAMEPLPDFEWIRFLEGSPQAFLHCGTGELVHLAGRWALSCNGHGYAQLVSLDGANTSAYAQWCQDLCQWTFHGVKNAASGETLHYRHNAATSTTEWCHDVAISLHGQI